MKRADFFFHRCSNLAAFLLPALALWLPSGYSYGAALLFAASLASVRLWWGRPLPGRVRWLIGSYGAMAVIWMMDMQMSQGFAGLDRPAKYIAAMLCLPFVTLFPARPVWFWMGLAFGACGSGWIALYQIEVLSLPRATGFTNAIQYGNLSLLLALICGVTLIVQWVRWRGWQRILLVSSVVFGGMGSMLSQSRGGWLALVVAMPVCAWLMALRGQRQVWWGVAVLVVSSSALLQVPAVQQRVAEALQEARTYQSSGDGTTSVGQRLAHWRLAWAMGWDRPWTGWGHPGYETEKARRVGARDAPAVVLQYSHAHNEVLDLFAKHGIPGVLVLLLFYAIPLALFWPTTQRVIDSAGQLDRQALCLHLVGVLLPLSYIAFGLTQAFLAHNSGNMFYLFMCIMVLGTLQRSKSPLLLKK